MLALAGWWAATNPCGLRPKELMKCAMGCGRMCCRSSAHACARHLGGLRQVMLGRRIWAPRAAPEEMHHIDRCINMKYM